MCLKVTFTGGKEIALNPAEKARYLCTERAIFHYFPSMNPALDDRLKLLKPNTVDEILEMSKEQPACTASTDGMKLVAVAFVSLYHAVSLAESRASCQVLWPKKIWNGGHMVTS